MAVASFTDGHEPKDIVYTSEPSENGHRITAHDLAAPGASSETVSKTIYTHKQALLNLKVTTTGSVLVATSGPTVVVGKIRELNGAKTNKIKYDIRVFDSAEDICSIDLKIPDTATSQAALDLVVGDVKGSIFAHVDVIGSLFVSGKVITSLRKPRKLHWHRRAVHTVKYSQDGKSHSVKLQLADQPRQLYHFWWLRDRDCLVAA